MNGGWTGVSPFSSTSQAFPENQIIAVGKVTDKDKDRNKYSFNLAPSFSLYAIVNHLNQEAVHETPQPI
jgi:hypothetical protein